MLERQNAALRTQVSTMDAEQRVQDTAARDGLVMPSAGGPSLPEGRDGERGRRRAPDHAAREAPRDSGGVRTEGPPGRQRRCRPRPSPQRRPRHRPRRPQPAAPTATAPAATAATATAATPPVAPATGAAAANHDAAALAVPLLDRRIGLLFAVFLVLLGAAFARALYFGTIRGSALAQVADDPAGRHGRRARPPRHDHRPQRRRARRERAVRDDHRQPAPHRGRSRRPRSLAPLLGHGGGRRPAGDHQARQRATSYVRRQVPGVAPTGSPG